jgi:hypothetical protein
MPDYYFLCPYPLRVGSIVEPGNWGRILRRYTPGNANLWLIVKEQVYEQIRREQFPALPSRLTSAFVCETLNDLRDFQTRTNRQFDLPYRVELVDVAAPSHRCCISQVDSQQGDTIPILEQRAMLYWAGNNIQRPEIITSSALRLVEGPL